VEDVEDEAVQDLRHHRTICMCTYIYIGPAAPYGGTVCSVVWGHRMGHHTKIAVLSSLPLTTTHYDSLLLTTTAHYPPTWPAHLAIVDLRVVGVLCEGEVPYRPLAEAVVPVEEGEERQVGLVPWCEY